MAPVGTRTAVTFTGGYNLPMYTGHAIQHHQLSNFTGFICAVNSKQIEPMEFERSMQANELRHAMQILASY